MIAGKVWGSTRLVFANPVFEVHRIEVKANGFCSKHKHLGKFNAFYIESGELEVTVWKNDYDLTDVTTIGPLERMTVKPGEFHRFRALSAVVAYELYWSELDHSDIEREDHGGADQTSRLTLAEAVAAKKFVPEPPR